MPSPAPGSWSPRQPSRLDIACLGSSSAGKVPGGQRAAEGPPWTQPVASSTVVAQAEPGDGREVMISLDSALLTPRSGKTPSPLVWAPQSRTLPNWSEPIRGPPGCSGAGAPARLCSSGWMRDNRHQLEGGEFRLEIRASLSACRHSAAAVQAAQKHYVVRVLGGFQDRLQKALSHVV